MRHLLHDLLEWHRIVNLGRLLAIAGKWGWLFVVQAHNKSMVMCHVQYHNAGKKTIWLKQEASMVNRDFCFFMFGKHRIILAANGAVYSLGFGAGQTKKLRVPKDSKVKSYIMGKIMNLKNGGEIGFPRKHLHKKLFANKGSEIFWGKGSQQIWFYQQHPCTFWWFGLPFAFSIPSQVPSPKRQRPGCWWWPWWAS